MYSQMTGDTIHVSHYDISIDTIDYSVQSIRGNTLVSVHSKMNNVNKITLRLLHLTIDSIISGTQNLAYSYDDTLINITPSGILNIGDSEIVHVYYHGIPQMDPSGWGGFYFNGTFAFTLGVGFNATPHNFGRVWFPCVDEFTDRATYTFHILTPDTYKAFCNGILQNETNHGDGTKTWDWVMNQPIPTYLACMAVAPFYTMNRTYSGVPCEYAILPADSVATIASFANIGTAVSTFINDYGPYPFDKIGFVITPVVYGGMEHASSIHISKIFVDGTLSNETLFAHELSHMWWGDNVTCKTEGDMWLNEGFATFNESRYKEAVYGLATYKTSFHTIHRQVLQFAHIEDGGYQTLHTVPHEYTYSKLSVYNKGALTAHTLRNFMGDAAFFQGCRDYQHNLALGNASSYDFRDQLATSSGLNLDDFFSDWVFTPGFPHFSIDSTQVVSNGSNFDVTIYMRQKRKGAVHDSKMKVEINFTDGTSSIDQVFLCNAHTNMFTTTLNFKPTFISVDRNEKMMDAITDFENTISTTGVKSFPETNVSLNVINTGTGTSIVRIEHHFVPPDSYKYNPGIRVSDYHYWTADGIFASGFLSKATFTYDGSISNTAGFLDNTFITAKEDSLVLLYRAATADEWGIVQGYIKNTGSITDKRGTIVVDTLKRGEYTLGYYDYTVKGINAISTKLMTGVEVYPNPSKGQIKIKLHFPLSEKEFYTITIFDILGKKMLESQLKNYSDREFNFVHFDKGIYLVKASNGDSSDEIKFILE